MWNRSGRPFFFTVLIWLVIGSFLSVSCNPFKRFSYYTLYLSVKDLNGLKAGAVVLSKGIQVGKVEEVKREEGEGYVAVLSLNNDYLVPLGSEVRIVSDLDNTSAYLEVIMSHSKRNYPQDDTIVSQGTVLLNKDIQLEEVTLNTDSLEPGIRTLLQ